MLNKNRAGYYVNGVHHYGLDKRAQALAKAKWLESEYGRSVKVTKVEPYDDCIVERLQSEVAA